jgi:phage baseplate assembly protein W
MAFLGIRYPFTSADKEKFFLDLTSTDTDEVKTMILHIMLTPIGQRYRMPSFGSNLLKYIFEPNDTITINDIKLALETTLSKYIPGITLDNIKTSTSTDAPYSIYIRVDYTVTQGVYTESDFVEINL